MKKTKKIILGLFVTAILMLVDGLTGSYVWANEAEVDFAPTSGYAEIAPVVWGGAVYQIRSGNVLNAFTWAYDARHVTTLPASTRVTVQGMGVINNRVLVTVQNHTQSPHDYWGRQFWVNVHPLSLQLLLSYGH